MRVVTILIFFTVLLVVSKASTEFDESLKPQVKKVTGSVTQKSVADILAQATGKLDKSKAKKTASKQTAASKRKPFSFFLP